MNRNFFNISILSLEKQTLETISIKSKDQQTISKPQEDGTRRSHIVARALEEVYFFVFSIIHQEEEEELGLEEEEEEFEVPKKGIPSKEEENESEYEYEYDESEDEGTAFALRHRPVFIPKVRSIKKV